MADFWEHFHYTSCPAARERSEIVFGSVRLTVLTDRLLRVETQKKGRFCDLATQRVVCRAFPAAPFTLLRQDGVLRVTTQTTEFCYDAARKRMLYIRLSDGRTVTDYKAGNLKGTCRTLDMTNGKTALSDGILSRGGVAVMDDSDSLTVSNRGDLYPRANKEKDEYYFAYGSDYYGALKDYFTLTGFPPLIPRFALGNWWSRYKAYTQEEYEALIDRFAAEEIPLSVATVDMDWHWVDVVKKFGPRARGDKKQNGVVDLFYAAINPGWTGYSWNTDLFPDPKGFLAGLKEKGLKITLNLHPASGCKFYEDAYGAFCAYLGIDPDSKKQIRFDITDKRFMEGYFRFLHHPMERDGVDFWWIDWQQGSRSKVPGLDPLWALNHYHYLDSGRNGKRPLILSRFAGAGSHRYPLGFSGDSAQTWKTLDFQPYFTATASNIGYTWWSHDIGGHHMGYRDDELYLRWVQYGVFSPILRLHSTSNEFMGKEPWNYNSETCRGAIRALRFRHRLIPYLYTMNRRSAEGRPLICPMYYDSPEDPRAYAAKNCYAFGTELIVCPITEKADPATGLASAVGFLPAGRYTDIFTGRIYSGDRTVRFYRDRASIPVLAKEGAILPLAVEDRSNSTALPQRLEVLVYRGNGAFTLYEDDGETNAYQNGAFAETAFTVKEEGNTLLFEIAPVSGDAAVVPQSRDYRLSFRDVADAKAVRVSVNGSPAAPVRRDKKCVRLEIINVTPQDRISVCIENPRAAENEPLREQRIRLISRLQGGNLQKKRFEKTLDTAAPSDYPAALRGAMEELEALWRPVRGA